MASGYGVGLARAPVGQTNSGAIPRYDVANQTANRSSIDSATGAAIALNVGQERQNDVPLSDTNLAVNQVFAPVNTANTFQNEAVEPNKIDLVEPSVAHPNTIPLTAQSNTRCSLASGTSAITLNSDSTAQNDQRRTQNVNQTNRRISDFTFPVENRVYVKISKKISNRQLYVELSR